MVELHGPGLSAAAALEGVAESLLQLSTTEHTDARGEADGCERIAVAIEHNPPAIGWTLGQISEA